MGKYGMTAVKAANLLQQGRVDSPPEAWRSAAHTVFPDSMSSQQKGCPRDTFLGLCQEGLVRGIPRGKYTRSELNKEYGLTAIALLRHESALAKDARQLWRRVVGAGKKVHNQQMDVVISLWEDDLIKK